MKMTKTAILAAVCFAAVAWAGQPSQASRCNLVVNPDFERTYAARKITGFTESGMPGINLQYRQLPGFDGKPFMPYGWGVMPNRDGAGVVSVVQDGGSHALRVQTAKGEAVRLRQCYIEVVPEATYCCGVWVKGKGGVNMLAFAQNPAVAQGLTTFHTNATSEWTKLSANFKIGFHRHLVILYIDIEPESDVQLRGVEFSLPAEADSPDSASRIATRSTGFPGAAKLQSDKDTLYFEDFEGDKTPLIENGQATLTDAQGGRFGRGLHVAPTAGGAKARMTFGKIPEQGTIEYWYKPDALPNSQWDNKTPLILRSRIPDRSFTGVKFEMGLWETVISFGFQTQQWGGFWAQDPGAGGWGWWQTGTWHHFAGTWDAQAMRLYVDGLLCGICYGKDYSGRQTELPHGEAMQLELPAPGVIDEIRISKVCRFGAIVPAGLTNPSFLAGAPPVEDVQPSKDLAVSRPRLETTEKELDAVREKTTSAVPEIKAQFVFGAGKAKPVWEGMAGMTLVKDYFGKGADGVSFDSGRESSNPPFFRPSAIYWKMENIQAGKYHIGLWLETQNNLLRTEYSAGPLLTMLYLNGYPVRFSTTSDPVQVKPGVWLAELQSAQAVELKPGDELAARAPVTTFLRLALYGAESSFDKNRGHGVTGQTFGLMGYGSGHSPRLSISVLTKITGSGRVGEPLEASITLANPLPYTVETVVDWKLADYFGSPVKVDSPTVRIEPHAVQKIVYSFKADAAAKAYQLDVKTHAAKEFQPFIPRLPEMIELNDWTKLELLPSLPGPMDKWEHARLDLLNSDSGIRKFVSLDGNNWDLGPMVGRRIPKELPADIKYTGKTFVPYGRYPLEKGVFGRWNHKKFRVPEYLKGETFQILVGQGEIGQSLVGDATFFLNGRRLNKTWERIGERYACCLDATPAIKTDGENDLTILIRGGIAQVKEEYVDKFVADAWRDNGVNQDFPGSYGNECNLGSVRLEVSPAVHVRQTLVLPDVEANAIVVLSRVENTRNTPCEVDLKYQAFQEGKAVEGAFDAQHVSLKPGQVVEVRAKGVVKGLKPYTWREPVLAKMSTTIVEAGATLDVQEQRFGYRDVKVKGDTIALNGQPFHPLGKGCNDSAQEYVERENGMQTSRGLVVSDNFGDEIGRLAYPLICCIPVESWEQLNNDKLWERDRANAIEVLWSDGNHPCNIGWDIFNECYHYNCYAVGLDGQAKSALRYSSIAKEVWKKVSPDLWFLSDGDETLGGNLNFCSWHYYNQGWAYGYATGEHGFGDRKNGTSGYPPDRFFMDGAASEPLPTTIIRGTSISVDDWKLGMPCAATEEFWFTDQNNGLAIAKYLGDRAAVSSNWQFNTGRGMWWTRLSVQGYRDLRASVLSVYPINFLNMVMQNVTFALPQQEVRYYSGAKFERRINIHDDDFAPGHLEFAWKLLGPDGKEALPGASMKMESTTSLIKRDKIAFTIPTVQARTEFVLDITLTKNGLLREHEQRIVEVWPPLESAPKAETTADAVALFDPEGKTQAVLERFGCKVKTVASLSAEALAGSHILVVGPDCAKAQMPAEQQALREFAAAGGRVLVLSQQEAGLIPADTYFEKRNHSTLGFVVDSTHPVMQGLKDRDFAMWNPGHLVAKGLYRMPVRGNFLPLVECYHMDPALVWSPLWELYVGKGSILATQLPLVAGIDTEPMAGEMWRRLLGYLAKASLDKNPRAESKLAVLQGASDSLLGRLKELRADFETVASLDTKPAVAMVELNQKDFAPQTDAFRKYVQNGGTLVLHRARPEHKEWLEALTGQKVSVEIQPWRAWVDRQILETRDGLARGLTNIDFYWRPNLPGEGQDSTCEVSNGVKDGKGQVEYLVKVDGAQEYLFPGGWVELKLGNGRIIIDQLKWEIVEKDMNYYGSPTRVASMLLTNLGILQKPPAPRPTLPENVKYQTIDLASVVNRGLVDDKADDGIGWIDWGPQQDLRDFPTGDVTFGVPFHVTKGDKNAVVLRSRKDIVKSLVDYPESVTIPVNLKNVGGLWFLHTGGWTYGALIYAWREIHYTDGSKVSMGLNGTNFADWNYGHDNFPDEEETTTTIAWKGACKMYPVTRVYKTLWVNPCPQKEIKEVVLTCKGTAPLELRFVAHLAVTAAIMPETTVSTPTVAHDPQKSQTLLQEALKLREAKKDADALAALEGSLKADDQNAGAWMALTEIHAQSDTVQAFTALCQRWFQAMPKNYQAHNALGQFLEKKEKYADALVEYQQSLKLEWNQPPTIEKVKALKEKLRNP